MNNTNADIANLDLKNLHLNLKKLTEFLLSFEDCLGPETKLST